MRRLLIHYSHVFLVKRFLAWSVAFALLVVIICVVFMALLTIFGLVLNVCVYSGDYHHSLKNKCLTLRHDTAIVRTSNGAQI